VPPAGPPFSWPSSARIAVHRTGGLRFEAPAREPATCVGDVVVEVARGDETLRWAVRNESAAAVSLDCVRFVTDAGAVGEFPRMFCNGYQSWSETRARLLGVDEDPSRHPRSFRFFRTIHHADPNRADPRELRSELVTAIDRGTAGLDGSSGRILVGFLGGANHEGTIRARVVEGRLELVFEAWLGGARLAPGERRALHEVEVSEGDDVAGLLDRWAQRFGQVERARVSMPYQVGWCSWYHYFHDIDETALRANLARSGDWPFTVFQLDDGYQAAIGDWLDTNEKFPSDLGSIAGEIRRAGRVPGLWIAPFLAAPASRVAQEHPALLARAPAGDEPLIGMHHEMWGGAMWQLDTTHPETLSHLEAVARGLRERGYDYLKLDFTFSPTFPGRYHDASRTPAERVRAGYEAIRRGAGDDAFILACGCPLGSVVGVVDAMRIGPDVSPSWEVAPHDATWPGYEATAPSTRNAWNSTLLRAFLHRRLWLNDPDCLMLRRSETALNPEQMRAWSLAVGTSGGLALVSDDLGLLDRDARALLDEVVALGRVADDGARHGDAPSCTDLLSPAGPTSLASAAGTLVADPADPHPTLEPSP